jgi:hypothetical protein
VSSNRIETKSAYLREAVDLRIIGFKRLTIGTLALRTGGVMMPRWGAGNLIWIFLWFESDLIHLKHLRRIDMRDKQILLEPL